MIRHVAAVFYLILISGQAMADACIPNERVFDAARSQIVNHGNTVVASGKHLHVAIKDPLQDPAQKTITGVIKGSDNATARLEVTAGECNRPECEVPAAMQKWHVGLLQNGEAEDIAVEAGHTRFFDLVFSVERFDGTKPVLLFQLWQGAPHAPPFAGVLKRATDGSLSVELQVQNNQTGSNPSATPIVFGRFEPLTEQRRYLVRIRVTPLTKANVTALVTIRDEQDSGASDRVFRTSEYIGYNLASNACMYAQRCDVPRPNQKLDFSFGVYRPAEGATDVVSFWWVTSKEWSARGIAPADCHVKQ